MYSGHWFLTRPTRSCVSFCATNRIRFTHNPVYVRRWNPSVLSCSTVFLDPLVTVFDDLFSSFPQPVFIFYQIGIFLKLLVCSQTDTLFTCPPLPLPLSDMVVSQSLGNFVYCWKEYVFICSRIKKGESRGGSRFKKSMNEGRKERRERVKSRWGPKLL